MSLSSIIMSNLSATLADQNLNKMTEDSSVSQDKAWATAYMDSLVNPFSVAMKSPKLLDGEIERSAAFKVRSMNEIVCNPNGYTNIIIFAGLTNSLCYCVAPDGNDNSTGPLVPPLTDPIIIDGTIYKQHLSTEQDRALVRLARLTGAGARFWLTNSCDEDDGYWEAVRLTSHYSERDVFFKTDSTGTYLGAGVLKALATDFDMANNSTYQMGFLKDIHKYIFKLNSEDNDHKFSPVSALNSSGVISSSNVNSSLADLDQWDMIFLKIRGRRSVTSPSLLRFDTAANQEAVYAENSILARMMDENKPLLNMDQYLTHSRIKLPGWPIE